MTGPTFPTLDAAGRYGALHVQHGMCHEFRLRRVPGAVIDQPDLPGVRLGIIRYAVILLDRHGREVVEGRA
jgi:hypothetical protein